MSGKADKKMLVGLNVFDSDVLNSKPAFELTAGGGIPLDYVVCHFDPYKTSLEEAVKNAKTVGEKFKELGMDFVANFEFQNFKYDCASPDGTQWAYNGEGLHRLELPGEYAEVLASCGNLAGIEYDELEHCIINRNLTIELSSKGKIKAPVFPLSESIDPCVQEDVLCGQLKEYADKIKGNGSPALTGEHVFPVLFHVFARSGIIPNFKSQKESCSNLQFAVAAGAALEYGTPLWNCVDLWYRLKNPGHSPDELYSNLEFAYFAGVNRVYVESSHPMVKDGALTEHGIKFKEFCEKYRGKDRDYDMSDYTPEICIIRQDDSFWGQWDPVAWKNMLFGNKSIKPDKRSKEYLKALNTLTYGRSFKSGLSWDRIGFSFLTRHRSFLPMNSLAVFDDRVGFEALKSVKLCFICGRTLSEETAAAVDKLVNENGMIAVTTADHLPAELKGKVKGSYCEIKSGNGSYIAVKNFLSRKLKKRIKPFLYDDEHIRLTFGEKEIKLKISPNGETFEITE